MQADQLTEEQIAGEWTLTVIFKMVTKATNAVLHDIISTHKIAEDKSRAYRSLYC